MRKLLFIFSTLLSFSALANPACLSQVSNIDLVNEISRRLGTNPGGGIGGNGALFTANCNSSGNLNLRTVSPTTGVQKAVNEFVGLDCQEYVNSLLQVSNVSLSRSILVSYCGSGGTLFKILVAVDGMITSLSDDFVGIGCKKIAIDSNNRLQP